jgi:hypothetical protein
MCTAPTAAVAALVRGGVRRGGHGGGEGFHRRGAHALRHGGAENLRRLGVAVQVEFETKFETSRESKVCN